MNKIGIIIQARLSSSRLPEKVLKNLCGKPMIQHLIERIQNSGLALPWVIATSNSPSDDLLAHFCKKMGYPYTRGPLNRVAERFVLSGRFMGWDHAVRICGDSPLLDLNIVENVLHIYQQKQPDLATNVWPRTFPKGQSVEVIHLKTLEKALPLFDNHGDQEHVTQYFYHHPQAFKIENYTFERDLSNLTMAVDTPTDWLHIEKLLNQINDSSQPFSLSKLLELMDIPT